MTEQITHSALCRAEHITNGAFDETRNKIFFLHKPN